MFNTASETTVICHQTWNLMASEACFHTKQLFQKGFSSSSPSVVHLGVKQGCSSSCE